MGAPQVADCSELLLCFFFWGVILRWIILVWSRPAPKKWSHLILKACLKTSAKNGIFSIVKSNATKKNLYLRIIPQTRKTRKTHRKALFYAWHSVECPELRIYCDFAIYEEKILWWVPLSDFFYWQISCQIWQLWSRKKWQISCQFFKNMTRNLSIKKSYSHIKKSLNFRDISLNIDQKHKIPRCAGHIYQWVTVRDDISEQQKILTAITSSFMKKTAKGCV